MDTAWPADLLAVRAPGPTSLLLPTFYVLRDVSGLYLLDAGFIGGRALLRHALRRRGWSAEPIRGIIVSHGHLDHILNVAPLARESGAWVAAPRLDAEHYAGLPRYGGWARVTGWLEDAGRPLLSFQPFVPDRWLEDGDHLDVWSGLRAIHLPGHTPGHMGFYCERLRLLLSADLFASYGGAAYFPPAIFNSAPGQMPGSVQKALALDLRGVVPNHGDGASPQEHLRRLQRLQCS